MTVITPQPSHAAEAALLQNTLASVREALSGLNYGQITLTVHDGRVVQIDVTEKRRLTPT